MTEPETVHEPAALHVAASGALTGRSNTYHKRLDELQGLYIDDAAFESLKAATPSFIAYRVEESRTDTHQGGLVIGTSTLEPGMVGSEYFMTRGHLHAIANRAELYYGLSGHGVMLMEALDGRVRTVEMRAGDAVHIPGNWVHRSINVGTEPLSTLFCYPVDAGQNYGIIKRAGGMATLVVNDGANGWKTKTNPRHRGYTLTDQPSGGRPAAADSAVS